MLKPWIPLSQAVKQYLNQIFLFYTIPTKKATDTAL